MMKDIIAQVTSLMRLIIIPILLVYLVCEKCGENSGICDRCYEMDKTCKDSEHVLTRYVTYKGEKNISKQFTEKDCCQFCKEQLGEGVFYCESGHIDPTHHTYASVHSRLIE
jgi:hypothetical protein